MSCLVWLVAVIPVYPLLFGVAPKAEGLPSELSSFQRWVGGGKVSLCNVDIGWTTVDKIAPQFDTQILPVWEAGSVPIITWMPYPYKTWTNPAPNSDIGNGTYDDYIDAFATSLSGFLQGSDATLGTADDRRAYLRFAPQPNGNWFPWSPRCPGCASTGQHIKQSPESYVLMWHHVQNRTIHNQPVLNDTSRLRWVWAANSDDAADGSVTMEAVYPGTNATHWVSVDGFNWGTTLPAHQWQSVSEIFTGALGRVRKLVGTGAASVPIGITTYGSTSTPKGVSGKSDWLHAGWGFFTDQSVRMVISFNTDTSTDFAVLGGTHGVAPWVDPVTGHSMLSFPTVPKDVNQTAGVVIANVTTSGLISDYSFATGEVPTYPVTRNESTLL